MARQNIEDIFWLEVTAIAAVRKVDPDKLAGNAQRFFRYAQEKYKMGKLVSNEEFEVLGFMEELIPMFAKRTEEGVRAGGESKYFGWLKTKSESGSTGGKRSAEVRKEKFGSAQPKQTRSKRRSKSEAKSKQPKHAEASSSSSLSFSPSLSGSDSGSLFTAAGASEPEVEQSPAQATIAHYCDLWRETHGDGVNDPPIVGKDAGIITRLLKDVPVERLRLYLDAYFQMPDAWTVKAKHPLGVFETKLKEVAAFADSGKFVTRRQAMQADDMTGNMILLQKVRRGEI